MEKRTAVGSEAKVGEEMGESVVSDAGARGLMVMMVVLALSSEKSSASSSGTLSMELE